MVLMEGSKSAVGYMIATVNSKVMWEKPFTVDFLQTVKVFPNSFIQCHFECQYIGYTKYILLSFLPKNCKSFPYIMIMNRKTFLSSNFYGILSKQRYTKGLACQMCSTCSYNYYRNFLALPLGVSCPVFRFKFNLN